MFYKGKKSRLQWPSYGTRHCAMPWCTTTTSLVILHQIALHICSQQWKCDTRRRPRRVTTDKANPKYSQATQKANVPNIMQVCHLI